MREKKFSRCEPDERRSLLIRSAIVCLEAEGHAGLSVRKITKEANLSQGMITHHFGSIDNLISCAYDFLANDLLRTATEQIKLSNNSPAEKLDFFFEQNFAVESMNPSLLKAWLVFWSLIPHSPHMAEAYKRHNQVIESLLCQLLIEINEEEGLGIEDMTIPSQSLMALLDGIWVRESLHQQENAIENALKISRNWVKMFRGGMFSE